MIKSFLTGLVFILGFQAQGFWDQRYEELSSPLKTPAKYYLFSSSLLAGALLINESLIDQVQKDTVRNKPLGQWSRLGDLAGQWVPNLIYAGATYGLSLSSEKDSSRKKYERLTSEMFQATLYAGLVTVLIKVLTQQPRPHGGNRLSFPSGHSATAFAFASVIGLNHHWAWGVGAYALATLVAYSRINDNAHFLHDVVAGSGLGMAYGFGIHHYKKRQSEDLKTSSGRFSLAPLQGGAYARYTYEF